MKFGVVRFPGTNCEQDALHALNHMGLEAEYVWHQESNLDGFDAIVLPGGFSYGDYLRSGAIARFSPVMNEVVRLAKRGNPVIGICNGFQVLTEAHLLPGALIRNKKLKFLCQNTHLQVQDSICQWLDVKPKTVLDIPISHHDGNYTCTPDDYARLLEERRIVLRYCEADGSLLPDSAPNGSFENIAGICNGAGNVFGLMPHPERVVDGVSGNTQGQAFFETIVAQVS
ncbi:MAG: phosphoribosylformylglycinamidine synthase subunit PurQ [Eggerthellaceae bacterium]|jgi:phosphoribosylformylglycinamidine synthase|nr:phosphoribosylformylglycinamidine synthase subunit PurQ [Eggerthellaceae bacterium]MDR2721469.1 phosphoribosylformylglycinamidine synthase subunit PurQ [Coriobacteriaceae bacterium]